MNIANFDYSKFDRPEILQFLFHPRSELGTLSAKKGFREVLIPVENDVTIGARLYLVDNNSPTILFFHGNGEIVEDYDEIGLLFNRLSINFFAVDYRGYGISNGMPTVTGMMKDCRIIFRRVKEILAEINHSGYLVVMGRSLGSASALEIAVNYKDEMDGLIIESGFAYTIPLLKLLGVDTDTLGISEKDGLKNYDKIRDFDKSTLIIHAQFDQIIPLAEGQVLFENCPAEDKEMLMIPEANHNNIFAVGMQEYLKSIQQLMDNISGSAKSPELKTL